MQAPSRSITVYYLEMLDRNSFRPKTPPAGFDVEMLSPPEFEVNRRFYRMVGSSWNWTDRLTWSDDDWRRYVHRDALRTWVGRVGGESVGYFELESQDGGDVQIAYFGLVPEFIGRGFGGPLLSAAIEHAWGLPGTRRVWVHTCTDDHKHALDNYRKRGFEVYKTEQIDKQA